MKRKTSLRAFFNKSRTDDIRKISVFDEKDLTFGLVLILPLQRIAWESETS